MNTPILRVLCAAKSSTQSTRPLSVTSVFTLFLIAESTENDASFGEVAQCGYYALLTRAMQSISTLILGNCAPTVVRAGGS